MEVKEIHQTKFLLIHKALCATLTLLSFIDISLEVNHLTANKNNHTTGIFIYIYSIYLPDLSWVQTQDNRQRDTCSGGYIDISQEELRHLEGTANQSKYPCLPSPCSGSFREFSLTFLPQALRIYYDFPTGI